MIGKGHFNKIVQPCSTIFTQITPEITSNQYFQKIKLLCGNK